MKENWYALYISIVKGVSVEEAFYRLQPKSTKRPSSLKTKRHYEQFSITDVNQMVEMKKNMSYKQVAQHFGTVDRNVYNHIKKHYPELINSGVLGYHSSHAKKLVS